MNKAKKHADNGDTKMIFICLVWVTSRWKKSWYSCRFCQAVLEFSSHFIKPLKYEQECTR